MTPSQRAEVEAIAAELESFGLRRNAARVRALAGPPPDDEKPAVIQDREGGIRAVPWGLIEILYPAYGHDQTLERLQERGGFGRKELGLLAADCYGSRPRLKQMPLLTLYQMAARPLPTEAQPPDRNSGHSPEEVEEGADPGGR